MFTLAQLKKACVLLKARIPLTESKALRDVIVHATETMDRCLPILESPGGNDVLKSITQALLSGIVRDITLALVAFDAESAVKEGVDPRPCCYCGEQKPAVDLRPYGPDAKNACYPCAMKPENNAETERQIAASIVVRTMTGLLASAPPDSGWQPALDGPDPTLN